jgi:DUF4097 and DUF4098 domain-containing protein YvlB
MAMMLFSGVAATALAQAPPSDVVKVPLTDPSRTATVKVKMISGGISVKGYNGKEVVVEAKSRDEERSSHKNAPQAAGMKRIPNLSSGLSIEEEDNVVSVGTGLTSRPIDIYVQVPARANLVLKTLNDGDIVVEQVQGEIEVDDLNGAVTLTRVSGSVVAHSLNGNVKATIAAVEPDKPMSFTSLNGDIDVTLPPEVKGNAVMKTDNGEIYSDFDVKIDYSTAKPTVEGSTGKGGKFKVKLDHTMRGAINGGGPELQFKTFNGNIYIRKSAK